MGAPIEDTELKKLVLRIATQVRMDTVNDGGPSENTLKNLVIHIAEWRDKAVAEALSRIKYRLPNPDNNVEEWRGHNLGLSQAIHLINEELARLTTKREEN